MQLPAMTLKAVKSGRKYKMRELGRPAVLLFHDQNTIQAAEKLNRAVRDAYPLADEVLVASIVDLGGVPSLLRGVVNEFLLSAYREGLRYIPTGRDPEDYIVILPDWKGKLARKFKIRGISRKPAILVVGPEGEVIGQYQGQKIDREALRLLAEATRIDGDAAERADDEHPNGANAPEAQRADIPPDEKGSEDER